MANVAQSFTPALIVQAPYDVYFAVAAPASSLNPTADLQTLTLDANGQPTDTGAAGFHSGAASGAAKIKIALKVNDIVADQFEAPIDGGMDMVDVELDITLLQSADLAHLLTYLGAANLGNFTATASRNILQLGGKPDSSVTPVTITLVAPRRDASGKYMYFLLDQAVLDGGVKTAYSRAKEALWAMKFQAHADLTRQVGDELMQIVRRL